MKRLIITACLFVLCATTTVVTHAQDANATSGASSNAKTNTSVNASNQGNSLGVELNSNSTADGAAHYTGTARILSNPGVSLGGAAAGFSNNNCANTMQGGLSGLRASVGVAAPKESKACNYRQNAATFYAAAGVRAANGQQARAEALMAMADVAACRAEAQMDATDMDNCRLLGIVGDRDSAAKFEPTPVHSEPPPSPAKPVQKGDFPTAGTETKQEKVATIVVHP